MLSELVKPGQEVSGLIMLIPILLLLAVSFLLFFLRIFLTKNELPCQLVIKHRSNKT